MQIKNSIFALILTVILFSCNSGTPDFVGSWNLSTIKIAGDIVSAKDIENPTYNFNEDHTYEIIVNGVSEKGAWKKEGDYLILVDFNNAEIENKFKIIESTPYKFLFSSGEDENSSEVLLVKN